jgi:hypothetical protein
MFAAFERVLAENFLGKINRLSGAQRLRLA